MSRLRARRTGVSYRDAVIDSAPVGYWRLGEASGTVARDEMGANNGAYIDAPTLGVPGLLAGDSNTAAGFAAVPEVSSGYMSAPGASIDAISGDWTIAIWITRTGIDTGYANLGAVRGSAYFGIFNSPGDYRPFIQLVAGGTYCACIHPNGLPLNVPVFLVAYRRDTELGISMNAGTVATASCSAGALAAHNGDPFLINHVGGDLNMVCDEAAIWNRALTAAEIANLYAIGRGA